MGYELINESGQQLCFNFKGYPRIIDLALQYEWEPLGTTMPSWHDEKYGKRDDWHGIYCSNDFQVVSAEDANNMADALERAQRDLRSKPITDPANKNMINIRTPNGKTTMDVALLDENDELDPSNDWAGDADDLTQTIEFLRLGSFETW